MTNNDTDTLTLPNVNNWKRVPAGVTIPAGTPLACAGSYGAFIVRAEGYESDEEACEGGGYYVEHDFWTPQLPTAIGSRLTNVTTKYGPEASVSYDYPFATRTDKGGWTCYGGEDGARWFYDGEITSSEVEFDAAPPVNTDPMNESDKRKRTLTHRFQKEEAVWSETLQGWHLARLASPVYGYSLWGLAEMGWTVGFAEEGDDK